MNLQEFAELLRDYKCIMTIGMCKNAGKTTVLNKILAAHPRHVLAISSIGRDGESTDIVTQTRKPPIYVREGTLVSTASHLLALCDTTKEIIHTTQVFTPLGRIVVFRAKSDGYVQIAGPSGNAQTAELIQFFKTMPCDKIIIDGAVSRKTVAGISQSDACILSSGASLDRKLENVVSQTLHAYRLLCIAVLEDGQAAKIINDQDARMIFIYDDYRFTSCADSPTEQVEFSNLLYLYFGKAVLDSTLDWIFKTTKIRQISIIVDDASKLFITKTCYERLAARQIQVLARSRINLIAISINPVAAGGYCFDKYEYKKRLENAVTIPVINALEDLK